MMTRNRAMRFRNRAAGFPIRPTSARSKLNQFYATGSLILAAFIGLCFNSWWAFGATAAVLLVLNVLGGDIRLTDSRR